MSRAGRASQERRGTHGDVEEVAAELDEQKVHKDDGEGFGGGDAEDLGVEAGVEARVEAGEEDVGDDGHDCGVSVSDCSPLMRARTRDVEVGRVEVVAGGLPFGLAVLGAADAAGPGLVPPGEEEEAELVHDVRIGHVEMVFEDRDGDQAAELRMSQLTTLRRRM